MLKIRIERSSAKSPGDAAPANPNDNPPRNNLDIPHDAERPPSFFGGILAPLILAAGGIWFGLLQKRIALSVSRRHWVPDINRYEGASAVWAGIALLALAVTFHAIFYRARTSYTPAAWYLVAVLALLGGLAAYIRANILLSA
jgi:hypothetical protein